MKNFTYLAAALLVVLVTSVAYSEPETSGPMNDAVEFLVFEMAPEDRNRFIAVDHDIWTPALRKQEGFLSKEVWIDKKRPNRVTLVTYWSSLKLWKAIPHEALASTDTQFKKAFGKPFKLIQELHKVHGWRRVKNTTGR